MVVLQMSIKQYSCRDQMVWNTKRNGIFKVRLEYNLACSLRKEVSMVAESSRTREDKGRIWRKVWQLPVKPKLKHFLWRCLHNWLAVDSTVKVRGMEIDETCKRCGMGKETREHIFFNCRYLY